MRFRKQVVGVACLSLILTGLNRSRGQQAQEDTARIERLVSLCKLWGAVKYFHPYLAYRQDIDWDKALVETIPKVTSAGTPGDYASAVAGMLEVLGDPATHVMRKPALTASAAANPAERAHDPLSKRLSDDVLAISITHYSDLTDFAGLMQRGPTLREEIQKARAGVIDLRPLVPLAEDEKGALANLFDLGGLAGALSSTSSVSAGERRRMHMGFVPQRGSTSGGYQSAFYTAQGQRITPARRGRDVPIVFLVDHNSELPPAALAIQRSGTAAIVAEGAVDDSAIVTTQRIHLVDGVDAQFRLGEIIYEDGTGGLEPDLTVPQSAVSGDQNPAFQAALTLARKFQTSTPSLRHLPASFVSAPDKAYEDMSFPPAPYRLLAAFRIWTVIHYFFPYEELMGEDWDGVLRQYISRLERTSNTLEYHLAIAEMVTHIHDGHGFVSSPTLADYLGRAPSPVRLRMIEGLPVVTAYWNEEAAREAGVAVGDVILKVEGESAGDRLARLERYLSASTEQWRVYRALELLLSGPENSTTNVTVRSRNDEVKELKLLRMASFRQPGTTERTGEPFRLLAGNIGYADLDRLTVPMVDEMFEKFKDTRAIIFDDRTYPQGTAWAIAPRLAPQDGVVAAMFQRRIAMSPDAPLGEIARSSVEQTFFQRIPSTDKWRYRGRTVMLMDERTMSQAEHTGLFFEAANGTKFIGSPTAGANGDVTNFCVPGNIWISFTGQSVRHADGRQLQRVGLMPDLEARPTLAGIRAGRDEVLERAIEYLQKELR